MRSMKMLRKRYIEFIPGNYLSDWDYLLIDTLDLDLRFLKRPGLDPSLLKSLANGFCFTGSVDTMRVGVLARGLVLVGEALVAEDDLFGSSRNGYRLMNTGQGLQVRQGERVGRRAKAGEETTLRRASCVTPCGVMVSWRRAWGARCYCGIVEVRELSWKGTGEYASMCCLNVDSLLTRHSRPLANLAARTTHWLLVAALPLRRLAFSLATCPR